MSEEGYLVGVDGGQTATRALIARFDRSVLGQGTGGPLTHFQAQGGFAQNRAAIQAAILGACDDAGIAWHNVRSIALGLTGVQLDAPEAPTVERIVREVLSPEAVTVVPDYVSNLAGASCGEPGIVVIAGSGSIAYGVTADGRDALVGGYGFLVGDEGSGFDIGRTAAMLAIRASEGRGAPTVLESMVMQHFQLTEMRQLFHLVYDAGFSRERLTELTPLVARAAQDGDSVARQIMRRSGTELARTCLGVIRKLYEPGDPATVYLSGGVWSAGEIIQRPFRQFVARCWYGVDIRLPRAEPVVGALILAARQVASA
jgi:N-acetylglucosamine kinase-like BadF-type ATPase